MEICEPIISVDLAADFRRAAEVVRGGGIIIYPTDTVWGIGCDATNPEAIARVFDIKQRDDSKALVTLMPGMDEIQRFTGLLDYSVREMVESSSKPLTVVYPTSHGLPKNLTASDGSVAIRIPVKSEIIYLCRLCAVPLVSTSANISGMPTPVFFKDIPGEILDRADYVCSSFREADRATAPSRIIKLNADNSIEVLRP